ncbi:MAG: DUF6150 family protein [Bacteroidota bacterium]
MALQRKLLLIFANFWCFLLISVPDINAQLVYSVQYKSEADVKVYVAKYKSEADLVVWKAKYKSEVDGNKGVWFFTEYKSEAQKNIYFVQYKSEADLVIYFAEYKSEATWENKKKQQLMY